MKIENYEIFRCANESVKIGDLVLSFSRFQKQEAKNYLNWAIKTYAWQGYIFKLYSVTSNGARVRIW